jgi:photosystem II stability/assembly factor-like uncharacterized protein
MKKSISLLAASIFGLFMVTAQKPEMPTTLRGIAEQGDISQLEKTVTQTPTHTLGLKSTSADPLTINWTNFGAGFTAANAIKYSPSGTTLYGAKGSAIYKSMDDGKTWQEIFKIPGQSYLSVQIGELSIHPSDTNTLYYNVQYAQYKQDYGVYKLDLLTNTHEEVYGSVDILNFEILGTTNTDTIVVMVWDNSVGHETWVTVDGGQWWKNIHSGTFKEGVYYYYNNKNNKELILAGENGLLYLDFDEAWETQQFNWKNEIITIERGDSVEFTRTIGPMVHIPGTNDFLTGKRWFSTDRYDNGDVKRSKFWRVSFDNNFAAEYTNVPWNDDTTRSYDPKDDGRFVSDYLFSFAIDPYNPDVWWGGEGNEIIYTNDAGLTWESDTFAYREMWIANQIEIDPKNSNHLFMLSESGTIETFDGWTTITERGIQGLVLQDMDFQKDAQGNPIFFYSDWSQWTYCENNNGEILGRHQLDYDFPVINRVLADPHVPGRAFYTAGHDAGAFVHRTSDFGNSEELSINSTGMGVVRTIEANPLQPNEIWIIGSANTLNPWPTAMKSRYGGDPGTWNQIIISESGEPEYGYHDFLAFNPENKDVVYSNGFYTVGIEVVVDILRSNDGGKNWTKYTEENGLPRYGDGIVEMVVNPYDTAMLFGSTFTMPYVSNDGGISWNEQTMKIEGYDTLSYYNFRQLYYTAFENVMIGLGGDNNILISNNNGKYWRQLRDGETLSHYNWIGEVKADVNADSTKLIIYCSTDGASMFKLELDEADLHWENPVDESTGLTDTETREMLKVFPNPTSGSISVETEPGATVSIYTQNGSLISQAVAFDNLYTTNALKGYPVGVYYISVTTNNGVRANKIILTE